MSMTPDEITEQKRLKQIKILKASNEMLKQAKESMLSQEKLTDLEKEERLKEFDKAIDENYLKGSNLLNSSKKEIENAKYDEVSDAEKKKYEEYLKKKGITDGELHEKELATASMGSSDSEKHTIEKKKRRRNRKSTDEKDIQRVENEDELMKKSMAKSDEDIQRIISIHDREDLERIEKQTSKKKVKTKEEVETNTVDIKTEEKKVEQKEAVDYTFDFSQIPDYVQYDVIPLPSNGECYPHHIGRVPVAYLTAYDENIISSPNMYRDGKVIDVILERKILDKRIKASELCQGDRDAIILWLRATGYGNTMPVSATNPENGKRYNLDVDLSSFKYKTFELKGDKEGLFEYKLANGDVFKYKYLTSDDNNRLKENMIDQRVKLSSYNAIKYADRLQEYVDNINDLPDDDRNDLNDCIADIKDILSENTKVNDSNVTADYLEIVTETMKSYTVSINGNRDREYIDKYIDNMRSLYAKSYMDYVVSHQPGVDFKFKVNIPQSDGGGSFETFLALDDTVFITV